jgi:hypothetical protein
MRCATNANTNGSADLYTALRSRLANFVAGMQSLGIAFAARSGWRKIVVDWSQLTDFD